MQDLIAIIGTKISMKKIKNFLCKIGLHNYKYTLGELHRCGGFYWKDCKWCKKQAKEEFSCIM